MRLLLERGYDVIVLDNLYTGSRDNVLEGAQLIVEDVADRNTVARVVKKADYIIHLVAIVNVEEARENPFEVTRVNVLGILNLLEESYRQNIERFVYDSSSAVYGEHEKLPISEAPLRPMNTQGATKLAGDVLINAYHRKEKELSTISLRYFNVYDLGMRGGPYAGVIYKFIKLALMGKPLTIYGDEGKLGISFMQRMLRE